MIFLELLGIFVYWGLIPWLVLSQNSATPIVVQTTEIALETVAPTDTATPTIRPTAHPPSPTSTLAPTATSIPSVVPTFTSTPAPTETSIPTAISIPGPARIAPNAFASLVVNPRAMLTSKTTFFTSACYGENANPLQDRDFMTPTDWGGGSDKKCVYGYNVNPSTGVPTGRYSAGGGPDGQPRFYLIPPDAFADDTQSIKTLSQVQIIDDPVQGCDALGEIGVTADGLNYQCSACAFLRSAGVCPILGSAKSIVLPVNRNNILDANDTGGAYGFLGYPSVIFRKNFSLYFTGRAGYPPSRTYFESVVDTLAPNVNIKTTAEMTNQQVNEIAAQFDRSLTGTEPKTQLAALEREAQIVSSSPLVLKSRQQGSLHFATTPGAVLSSIGWRITPLNNQEKLQFLETNFCLDVNGEEFCFTGVEDFAHCAFYSACTTGYASLFPAERGGYVAVRYFPAGTAPVIRDGNLTAKFQAPDIGTVLEIQVQIKVRDVDSTLANQATTENDPSQ